MAATAAAMEAKAMMAERSETAGRTAKEMAATRHQCSKGINAGNALKE